MLRSFWFVLNVIIVVPVLIVLAALIILPPVKFTEGPDAEGYMRGASFDWEMARRCVFKFLTLSPLAMTRLLRQALDS